MYNTPYPASSFRSDPTTDASLRTDVTIKPTLEEMSKGRTHALTHLQSIPKLRDSLPTNREEASRISKVLPAAASVLAMVATVEPEVDVDDLCKVHD